MLFINVPSFVSSFLSFPIVPYILVSISVLGIFGLLNSLIMNKGSDD